MRHYQLVSIPGVVKDPAQGVHTCATCQGLCSSRKGFTLKNTLPSRLPAEFYSVMELEVIEFVYFKNLCLDCKKF